MSELMYKASAIALQICSDNALVRDVDQLVRTACCLDLCSNLVCLNYRDAKIKAEKDLEQERTLQKERARRIRADLEHGDSDADEDPWERKPIASRSSTIHSLCADLMSSYHDFIKEQGPANFFKCLASFVNYSRMSLPHMLTECVLISCGGCL